MDKELPSRAEIAELPEDGGKVFNRLIFETSPYLLQHVRNPVQWYSWGPKALEKAREEEKPIFLSVGYSTCHWCHVMERESFEDKDVASILNQRYVPIKVDREERPDLDEVYMKATQLLTGRGGWPNSLWLTPDGQPFYAGTYFPKDDRPFMHPTKGQVVQLGFVSLLERLATFWLERRGDASAQAERITAAIREASELQAPGDGKGGRHLFRDWLELMHQSVDMEHGGFTRTGPKFPPHAALRLLLWEAERELTRARAIPMAGAEIEEEGPGEEIPEDLEAKDEEDEDDERGLGGMAFASVFHTLEKMAQGGIYDHINGGFHRYSTDERWHVPHFEKMLYDNAQLAAIYSDAYRLSKQPRHARIARGTIRWILREMTGSDDGFYSAIDADSEGEEGRFYVWTKTEILEHLGEEDGELYCEIYGIDTEGNWHDEATGGALPTNIPYLKCSLEEEASRRSKDPEEFVGQIERLNARLLQVRQGRVWPLIDDKVLSAWNGLAISALTKASVALSNDGYLEAARAAATFVTQKMIDADRFFATYREGQAHTAAFLDDYAFMANGLLDLYDATHVKRWLDSAKRLADWMVDRFVSKGGGFYFTSPSHENLLLRTMDPTDKAIPSGNGIAVIVLLRLARLERQTGYLRIAEEALNAFGPVMGRFQRGTETLLLASRMLRELIKERSRSERETFPRGDIQLQVEPIQLSAYLSSREVPPDVGIDVALRVVITNGFHIQAVDAAEGEFIPTTIAVLNQDSFMVDSIQASPPQSIESGGETLEVHSDDLWILVSLKPKPALPERRYNLSFEFGFQACDESRCLEPEKVTFQVPVSIEIGAPKSAMRHKEIFDRFQGGGRRRVAKPTA